jgi:peptidyl-tRNA hydrolase
VLKPAKQAELVAIDEAIDKAQKAIPDWVRGDFEKVMRVLHAK